MGFNSAFKGLKVNLVKEILVLECYFALIAGPVA